jgi:hypothetical protein
LCVDTLVLKGNLGRCVALPRQPNCRCVKRGDIFNQFVSATGISALLCFCASVASAREGARNITVGASVGALTGGVFTRRSAGGIVGAVIAGVVLGPSANAEKSIARTTMRRDYDRRRLPGPPLTGLVTPDVP